MRTFDKSTKLDNVLYDVRGPVVDEAARMEEEGKEILKLNIGNPYPFGFSAPQEVILDMLSNIRTSQGYSDSKGIFSARKAIMQYAQLRGIPGVTMSDIYTGNGNKYHEQHSNDQGEPGKSDPLFSSAQGIDTKHGDHGDDGRADTGAGTSQR